MYRIERFLKVYEMGVQNCVLFVDLFKFIPESKDLINGTPVLSNTCLFPPQDVVDTFFDSTYQHSSKDLTDDW